MDVAQLLLTWGYRLNGLIGFQPAQCNDTAAVQSAASEGIEEEVAAILLSLQKVCPMVLF